MTEVIAFDAPALHCRASSQVWGEVALSFTPTAINEDELVLDFKTNAMLALEPVAQLFLLMEEMARWDNFFGGETVIKISSIRSGSLIARLKIYAPAFTLVGTVAGTTSATVTLMNYQERVAERTRTKDDPIGQQIGLLMANNDVVEFRIQTMQRTITVTPNELNTREAPRAAGVVTDDHRVKVRGMFIRPIPDKTIYVRTDRGSIIRVVNQAQTLATLEGMRYPFDKPDTFIIIARKGRELQTQFGDEPRLIIEDINGRHVQ